MQIAIWTENLRKETTCET